MGRVSKFGRGRGLSTVFLDVPPDEDEADSPNYSGNRAVIAAVKLFLEPLISTAVISALAWPASRLLAAAWPAWR